MIKYRIEKIMPEKILILGAGGFSGLHFCEFLETQGLLPGYSVCGADLTPFSFKGVRCVTADLTGYPEVEKLLKAERPDYIVNFSGLLRHDSPEAIIASNAGISFNVMEALVKNKLKVRKLLLIGSAAEYGKAVKLPLTETSPLVPVNIYGLAKTAQAMYAAYFHRLHCLPVCLARTFNLIGRRVKPTLAIGAFLERIAAVPDGGTIKTGDLGARRDYLDISDAVSAYWKCLTDGTPGEVYNVSSGASVTMETIVSLMIKHSGKKIKFETEASLLRGGEPDDSRGDNAKMRALGWEPRVSVETAVSRLFQA